MQGVALDLWASSWVRCLSSPAPLLQLESLLPLHSSSSSPARAGSSFGPPSLTWPLVVGDPLHVGVGDRTLPVRVVTGSNWMGSLMLFFAVELGISICAWRALIDFSSSCWALHLGVHPLEIGFGFFLAFASPLVHVVEVGAIHPTFAPSRLGWILAATMALEAILSVEPLVALGEVSILPCLQSSP